MTVKSSYYQSFVKTSVKHGHLARNEVFPWDRNRRIIATLFLMLILVFSIQPVLAQDEGKTTTSGILASNQTWNGTVHVTGDIVVPEGITLVIQPGTIITFAPNSSDNDVKLPVLDKLGINKCNLIVKGNLRIEGEKDNKVIIGELFYDVNRQTTITWGGIIFEGINVSSIIKHSEIRYADVAVVCADSSTPRIINSTIADNDVGIMTFDFSSPRIYGNKIHGNALWGVSSYDFSFPMISHNTVKGSQVGIGCEDSSFSVIYYNRFSDNSVGILIQGGSNPTRVGNIFSNNTKGIEIERSIRINERNETG